MTQKKILMHVVFVGTMLFIVYLTAMQFSEYNTDQMQAGKSRVIILKPESMSNQEYVNILKEIASDLSADLMYQRTNDEYEQEFYKTNINADFLDLYTENHSTLIKDGQILATKAMDHAVRIYGFRFFENEIIIQNFDKITDYNLSSGTFWVEERQWEAWQQELDAQGITYQQDEEMVSGDSYFSNRECLRQLMPFLFFLLLSVIFYIFAQNKEIAVKKSMGYHEFQIAVWELKENIIWFLGELFVLAALSFLVFFIWFDLVSVLLYMGQFLIWLFLLFMVLILACFLAAWYVSGRCTVENIKGKTRDRELFVVTVVAKCMVLVVLTHALIGSVFLAEDEYKIYRATRHTIQKVEGYAATTLSYQWVNPMAQPEKYYEPLVKFFTEMEADQAVVAEFSEPPMYTTEYSASGKINSIEKIMELGNVAEVNRNYLDIHDTILDADGNHITSRDCKPDLENVLVPMGMKEEYLDFRVTVCGDDGSRIHCMEYRPDSTFLTFRNNVTNRRDGYVDHYIINVVNILSDLEANDKYTSSMQMLSCLSDGLYFRYEGQDAYHYIESLVRKCGLAELITDTPTVKQRYYEVLTNYRVQLFYSLLHLVVYSILLLLLLIYSSHLYFINHKKELTMKMIHGYSFLQIYWIRMLLKSLSLFGIYGYLYYCQWNMHHGLVIWLPIFVVLSEEILFLIMMKKEQKKNILQILKEE
ncbi:MAG: DUF1430 domain-containing protein [Lachnospiraceae bacterium]|nr:DUF1430 domain-containing protein [Lachnospiraceae bacterium]